MLQQNLMNEPLTIGVRGDLKLTERLISTGEIVGEYEEQNVVLEQGKQSILRAFAAIANASHTVSTIKIGDDVGSGTVLVPEAATSSLSELNQRVVYATPAEEFFVSYPTSNSVRFLATINGPNVMSQYPTQPNVIYTSAAIYTFGGKAVTYKRFPARTISSLISVDISWTITLT